LTPLRSFWVKVVGMGRAVQLFLACLGKVALCTLCFFSFLFVVEELAELGGCGGFEEDDFEGEENHKHDCIDAHDDCAKAYAERDRIE